MAGKAFWRMVYSAISAFYRGRERHDLYSFSKAQPAFAERLYLVPEAIYHGEWWRLVTFLFIPPLETSPLFILFWLYLLYYYSQALEHEWGDFRFCLFYLVGALATIIASLFIVHTGLSNVWLNTTLILAFATLFPDFQLLILFIIPRQGEIHRMAFMGVYGLVFMIGILRESRGDCGVTR